jgi:hypothetical protein
MTASEHPQRCETCEHREIVHNYGLNTDRPRCKITKWFLDACSPTTIEHDFIDVVGCASHSSQPQPIVIRPSLMRFAEYMEAVLRRNDKKKSWENCTYEYLLNGIERETKELRECFWYPDGRSELFGIVGDDFLVSNRFTEDQVLSECADVANFAMMVFDVLMQREYKNGCASHSSSSPPAPAPDDGELFRLIRWAILFRDRNNRLPTGVELSQQYSHPAPPALSPIEETLEHQHDQYMKPPVDIIPDISGLQTFPFRCCSKCNDHDPTCHDECGAYKVEHDAQVAKAERERVLEEMFEFIDFNHSCPLDYVTCQRIKKYGEALRGGEQP